MTFRAYILLDRSGSMASHWSDDLGAINSYVRGLAESTATAEAPVTLVAFDQHYTVNGTEMSFEKVRRNAPAHSWQDVTTREITPRGGTPLYDAVGRMFNMIMEDSPEKAVVIIMTDGDENMSREVNLAAAKGYVTALNRMSYEVVFLGAEFKNVEKQSQMLGGFANKTMNTSRSMRGAAFNKLASDTVAYASTGVGMSFSADDKALYSKE